MTPHNPLAESFTPDAVAERSGDSMDHEPSEHFERHHAQHEAAIVAAASDELAGRTKDRTSEAYESFRRWCADEFDMTPDDAEADEVLDDMLSWWIEDLQKADAIIWRQHFNLTAAALMESHL